MGGVKGLSSLLTVSKNNCTMSGDTNTMDTVVPPPHTNGTATPPCEKDTGPPPAVPPPPPSTVTNTSPRASIASLSGVDAGAPVVAAPSAEDNTHTNSNQVDSTATTTAPAPPPLSSATLPSIDEAAALVVSTTLGFENLPVTPENGNGNGNVSESKKVTRKVSISNGQQDDRRGSHPGSSSDDSSGEDSSKSRKLDYRKTALLELQLGMGTMAMNTEDATGDETEDETYRARGGPKGKFVCYHDELGSGAFKTVYKGMDVEEAIEVAWNEMKVQRLSESEKKRLDAEVELLQKLRHKNVVQFFGNWTVTKKGQEKRIFITELMTSGTLKQFIRDTGTPKHEVLQKWCKQILSGLKYMHDKGIIHRDLKCDNIFIEGTTGAVKIGDLGLAMVFKASGIKCSVIGTPEFMAPEMYREEYSFPIDVWAFGMCVLEMITLEYPYSECSNPAQIYRKVSQGIKPAAFSNITGRNAPVRQNFILNCIKLDPAERSTVGQLLKHDFFKAVADDSVKRVNKAMTTINVAKVSEDGIAEMVLRKHADGADKKRITFTMDVYHEDVQEMVATMVSEGLIALPDKKAIANTLRVAVTTAKADAERHRELEAQQLQQEADETDGVPKPPPPPPIDDLLNPTNQRRGRLGSTDSATDTSSLEAPADLPPVDVGEVVAVGVPGAELDSIDPQESAVDVVVPGAPQEDTTTSTSTAASDAALAAAVVPAADTVSLAGTVQPVDTVSPAATDTAPTADDTAPPAAVPATVPLHGRTLESLHGGTLESATRRGSLDRSDSAPPASSRLATPSSLSPTRSKSGSVGTSPTRYRSGEPQHTSSLTPSSAHSMSAGLARDPHATPRANTMPATSATPTPTGSALNLAVGGTTTGRRDSGSATPVDPAVWSPDSDDLDSVAVEGLESRLLAFMKAGKYDEVAQFAVKLARQNKVSSSANSSVAPERRVVQWVNSVPTGTTPTVPPIVTDTEPPTHDFVDHKDVHRSHAGVDLAFPPAPDSNIPTPDSNTLYGGTDAGSSGNFDGAELVNQLLRKTAGSSEFPHAPMSDPGTFPEQLVSLPARQAPTRSTESLPDTSGRQVGLQEPLQEFIGPLMTSNQSQTKIQEAWTALADNPLGNFGLSQGSRDRTASSSKHGKKSSTLNEKRALQKPQE